MVSLVKDISTLTTIPERALQRLVEVSIYCINDAVSEDVGQENNVSEIDIGIGKLSISHEDNDLKFKFIPGAKLEEEIIKTIKNGQSTLEYTLERNLVKMITNTYKDII